MLAVLSYLALAAVATAVVWWGSGVLEDAADRLALHYGVPAVVQGATIAAVGSSTPELFSAVVATLVHGEFELGVAAIVGSAVFNILVIPALAALAGGDRDGLRSSRDVVYKEAQFYMLAVAVLLLTFAFAVIYNPTGDPLAGTMTPALAALPLALYGLYVFLQVLDTKEYELDVEPPEGGVARQWALLAVSLVVIVVAVEGLVRAAIGLGDAFGTPSFFWGLTVVAAGTSLPDALVSVKAADRGKHTTSLANVLGSNTFDLLVAVPAGVLVAGTVTIQFTRAAPMMGFLTLATVVLFALLRTDLHLSRREAYALLALYAAFVGWMLLETFGVTHTVR